jgi:hypothetical protein
MENILLTLVVVLLVLLLFMMGGLALLGWKLLNKDGNSPSKEIEDDKIHPEIKRRMLEARSLKAKQHIEASCHLHPKEPSEGSCAICAEYFCKSCLKPQQSLLFCREHLNLYLNSQWSEVCNVKSSPTDPEAGVELIDWKKKLWDSEGTPTFIQTHYKINVDGDQIESWVVLFAREKETDEVRKRLGKFSSFPAEID